MPTNYDIEYPELQKRFFESNRCIAELEVENAALVKRYENAEAERDTLQAELNELKEVLKEQSDE